MINVKKKKARAKTILSSWPTQYLVVNWQLPDRVRLDDRPMQLWKTQSIWGVKVGITKPSSATEFTEIN